MENSILYAVAVIAGGIIAAAIANIIVRWLRSHADKSETKVDDIVIAAIGIPLQVTVIAVSVYIALKYSGIVPEEYTWIISDQVINTFYIVIGAWVISAFVHNFVVIYGEWLTSRTKSDLDDRLIGFIELAARYIIWFAAGMLILSNLKIDITPFLAGAGIAGLALALAAQDIISNFFGGAIITVDKPFKVGDRIKVDQFYGDVISVGPRSTRLQTLEYQIVTIPNNKITSNVIINYSQPDPKLKMSIPVSVAYGTDVDRVTKILYEVVDAAIRETGYLHDEPKPQVFFTEFGASELKFIIRVWSKAYNTPDEVKDCLNRRINARFEKEGIEIPFQQIDIHMRS
ncbi:MAG: Small-conductance mechanosensitive channel MscMJ [Methanoregula sp. PtaU1.Bin051]|nr:MAG: Small-conductance mechanosensitive channel MscMJ [Methanoregula sp. PtaU1.Bin051]